MIDLKKVGTIPIEYDSTNKEYLFKIDGVIVAIIDQYGNLKIKGRVLNF